MPLTKLTHNGQITLPGEALRKLHLNEGDCLEAVVVGDSVLLRPISAVDREVAGSQASEAMDSVGPEPEPSKDETIKMIVDDDPRHTQRE